MVTKKCFALRAEQGQLLWSQFLYHFVTENCFLKIFIFRYIYIAPSAFLVAVSRYYRLLRCALRSLFSPVGLSFPRLCRWRRRCLTWKWLSDDSIFRSSRKRILNAVFIFATSNYIWKYREHCASCVRSSCFVPVELWVHIIRIIVRSQRASFSVFESLIASGTL